MILELVIDAKTIRELQDDARRLRLKLDAANKKTPPEIITINDYRQTQDGEYFKPF
jgi:hypothetical protein